MGFSNIGIRFVKTDGVVGVDVVDCGGSIHGHQAVLALQSLRADSEKENVGSNRFHQHPVVNGNGGWRRWLLAQIWPGSAGSHQQKVALSSAQGGSLIQRVGPNSTIEHAQGYSAPFEVMGAAFVSVDLDVHDYRIGLLDLSNSSQFHTVTESGRHVAGGGISAQESPREPGQKKENCAGAEEYAEHQDGSGAEQGQTEAALRVFAGLARQDARGRSRAAHFQEHES